MSELERVKKLMFGEVKKPIQESISTQEDLLGNKYRIIQEGMKYYIKKSKEGTDGKLNEDYDYIGGLTKKNKESYDSIPKASKQLNIIINSINEQATKKQSKTEFKLDKQLINENTTEVNSEDVSDFVVEEIFELNESNPFETLTLREGLTLVKDLSDNGKLNEAKELKGLLKKFNNKELNESFSNVELHYVNKLLTEQDLIQYDDLIMEEYVDLLDEYKVKLDLDDLKGGDDSETDDNSESEQENEGGEEEGADKEDSFIDEPFDAGVEANEDTQPKKFLEQLTGKIAQSLRSYNTELEEPDFDLEKYIINSIISALSLDSMPKEDIDDIIDKIKGVAEEEESTPDNEDEEPKEDGEEEAKESGVDSEEEETEADDVSTDSPLDEGFKKFEFYGYKGSKEDDVDFSVGTLISENEDKKSIKITYKSNRTGDLNIDGFVIAENKESAMKLLVDNKNKII